jgi:hypothetical protein
MLAMLTNVMSKQRFGDEECFKAQERDHDLVYTLQEPFVGYNKIWPCPTGCVVLLVRLDHTTLV